MKKITDRKYPYTTIRRCPRCGKDFEFLIRSVSQYRYYPPCPECHGIKGRGPVFKTMVDIHVEKAIAERRQEMFDQHTRDCATYHAMLRKHMGIHDKQEDSNDGK